MPIPPLYLWSTNLSGFTGSYLERNFPHNESYHIWSRCGWYLDGTLDFRLHARMSKIWTGVEIEWIYFASENNICFEGPGHNVMDWMFVSPLNSFVKDLRSSVAVFGDVASKEVIKINEVMRVGFFFVRICFLMKRDIRVHLCLCLPMLMHQKKRHCENITRRRISARQKRALTRKNQPKPLSQTSSLQAGEKK